MSSKIEKVFCSLHYSIWRSKYVVARRWIFNGLTDKHVIYSLSQNFISENVKKHRSIVEEVFTARPRPEEKKYKNIFFTATVLCLYTIIINVRRRT